MFPPPPRNERYLAAARVARGGVLCAPGGWVRLVYLIICEVIIQRRTREVTTTLPEAYLRKTVSSTRVPVAPATELV